MFTTDDRPYPVDAITRHQGTSILCRSEHGLANSAIPYLPRLLTNFTQEQSLQWFGAPTFRE